MATKKKVPEKKVVKKMTCLVNWMDDTWVFENLEDAVNCLSVDYTEQELMDEMEFYVIHGGEIVKVETLSLVSKGFTIADLVLGSAPKFIGMED